MAVGVQDEVVVADVVAAGAGIALDVVLAFFVDVLDQGDGRFLRHVLLPHHALDTIGVRGRDEDAQVVGMVPEHVETGTAGNDAGALVRQFQKDLRFGLVDIVGGDASLELLGKLGVGPHILRQREGCDVLEKVGQPVLLLALALLLGGAYLLIRRVISWHTPAAFIGTVALMSLICGKDPLYQILSGGLILGAFFMATDYATTPPTKLGKLIFGIGCGLITILIRFWGNLPEGVSFSILLMNIFTPYISKLTRMKPLTGGVEL